MAIKNKDYAKFVVPTEETTNIITGEIDELEFDFADADGSEAEKKDAKGNLVSVKNLKELKSKIRESRVKLLKKNKAKNPTFGGKALRYKKGQKDGKGGQIMPSEVANAFRNIAKKEGISINKAITKYQNKKAVAKVKQSFGQHDFDSKLSNITNKNLLVKVKDSSGKIYRFRGTGKQIIKDPQFQKIKTRNLNRIYKAIAPSKKRKK
mgnify:CR=1 FL=1|tara:strand:- start:692 stop:1315 length:624 start_codon:yes stop_codon:yes gene_type:complete